jgi:hypothetical protein
MKRVKKLSAMIDGLNVEVKLKRPLPSGFRLLDVLSGEQIKADMELVWLKAHLDEAEAKDAKTEAECGEMATITQLGSSTNYLVLVSFARRGVTKHYLFVFAHRGLKGKNETDRIIQEAIRPMLAEFNSKDTSPEERAVIFDNLVIKHLSPEELEKVADREEELKEVSRLKRELIEEILARTWEPEKPEEFLAMIKERLHKDGGFPVENIDELALKMRPLDIKRFSELEDRLIQGEEARQEAEEILNNVLKKYCVQ